MAAAGLVAPPQAIPDLRPDLFEYEDLKSWIAQQEALDLSNGTTRLTKSQRKALNTLRQLPPPEPSVGDKDWVSLLKLYRDAHRDKPDDLFAETAVPNPLHVGAPPHWTCTVALAEAPGYTFPVVTPASGPLPTFVRKKTAKQYAAKCAIDCLIDFGHMPDDGVNVVFPKTKTPEPLPNKHKSKPAPLVPVDAVSASAPAVMQSARTSDAGQSADMASPPAEEEADISTAARIPQLCNQLGMPIPRYVLMPDDVVPDLYRGYADFKGDMRVPHTVGVVEGVFGKKAVKEKMAEQVLEYLLGVEEDRKRILELVFVGFDD